ncbi:MAG: cytochrome c maturation protein CcmE [Actinomycetota bacterium]|nr:cytochrome c maturation protein CcmE [Actinomycetota bacterium]
MDQALPYSASRSRRLKLLIGGGVIVAALATLIVWALSRPGSTSFYMTVSELRASGPVASSELRVNGNVVPGSLTRSGIETTFAITDGSRNLAIVTDEPLPDAFSTAYRSDPSAVEIVAQGSYAGDHLQASQVLAKCPSKFKARA